MGFWGWSKPSEPLAPPSPWPDVELVWQGRTVYMNGLRRTGKIRLYEVTRKETQTTEDFAEVVRVNATKLQETETRITQQEAEMAEAVRLAEQTQRERARI